MGFLYKIRNTANDTLYVGQTTDTLNRRMIKHRSEAKRYARGLIDPEKRNKCGTCSKLYAAMNEIGIANFFMEQVGDPMDDELLDDAEEALIAELNTVENGYNLQTGGKRCKHSDETRKRIGVKTREGQERVIDTLRKHDEVKGMPMRCVYVVIKGSPSVAINKHSECKWKSFTTRKYGSMDDAKFACLEYYNTLGPDLNR